MKCKSCQVDLLKDAKFCHKCGTIVMTKFKFIQGCRDKDSLLKKLLAKIEEMMQRVELLEKRPDPIQSQGSFTIISDPSPDIYIDSGQGGNGIQVDPNDWNSNNHWYVNWDGTSRWGGTGDP